jgi:hypothetical protein
MQLGYESAKRFCFKEDKPAYALEILKKLVANNDKDAAKAAYLISVIYFTGLLDSQEEEPRDLLSLEDALPEIERMFNEGLNSLKRSDTLGCEEATLLLGKILLNGLQFYGNEKTDPIFFEGKQVGTFTNKIDFNPDYEAGTELLRKIKTTNQEAANLLDANLAPPENVFQFDLSFWARPQIPASASAPIPRFNSTGSNCSMRDLECYSSEDTDSNDEVCGSPTI